MSQTFPPTETPTHNHKMTDEQNTTKQRKWLKPTLIVIALIMIGVGFYFAWIQPTYSDFIQTKQQEAYEAGQTSVKIIILTEIQQKGYVQIPITNNQSIYLAPIQEVIK